MDWRDEGILLWVRRHGESNVIIEALTAEHGRHAGLVRGGATKSHAAVLQPGAQLSLEWKARLSEHLGTYKADLIRSRAAAIMQSREALAALNVISALLARFLPDREPNAGVYASTLGLVDELAQGVETWPVTYARWELALLEVLGFGLDLRSCAATGLTEELVFVSPRSGRAVCRAAGAPFADRMLPLPPLLLGRQARSISDVREALRTTGYFLEHWVCPSFEIRELPEARARFLRLLDRSETVFTPPGGPGDPVPDPDEEAEDAAWLSGRGP